MTPSIADRRVQGGDARVAEIDLTNAEAFGHRNTDPAAARRLAGEALAMADEAGYARGRAEAFRTQALVMHTMDEHSGFDLALEALAIFREEEDVANQATIHNILACFYHTFLQHDAMLEHLRAAYEIAEGLGDRRTLALVLNNMAGASEKLEDFPEAIRLYENCRAMWGEMRDDIWYWISTANMGYALYRVGALEEARGSLEEAVRNLRSSDHVGVVESLLNLAHVYVELGDFGEAEARIAEASERCEGGGGTGRHATTHSQLHLTIGEVKARRGDRTGAIGALLEARRLAIESGNRNTLRRTLRLLAEIAEAEGDFESAHRHLDEYLSFRETVFTEQMEARSRTFQSLHRVEWTQKEAQLVRQQNEELQLLNKRLVATIAEKDALHAEMTRHAVTDELTGVSNRRHLMEFGRREFERYRRLGAPLAVIMLDVDHFKSINDRFGHAAGDEVLKGIATVGGQGVRAIDAFGRWGGEEFCIVLPGARLETARRIAERIRVLIEGEGFGDVLAEGSVTASLGIAEVEPRHRSLDDLLNDADAALYEAKRGGRNRVTAYAPCALAA